MMGKGGSSDSDEYGSESNLPFANSDGVLKDVNFDYDSSSINSEARMLLNKNAEWLQANQSTTVSIEGHCDERGTAEYNLALGERRARSVFDYLRSAGIKTDRMQTISYGEELPLDSSSNDSAWAKNRRAHFGMNQ